MKIALAFLLVAVSCTRDVSSLPADGLLGGSGGGGDLVGGLVGAVGELLNKLLSGGDVDSLLGDGGPLNVLLGGLLDGLLGDLIKCLRNMLSTNVPKILTALQNLGCALKKQNPDEVKEKTLALLETVRSLTDDESCLADLLDPLTDALDGLVKSVEMPIANITKTLEQVTFLAGVLSGVGELICPVEPPPPCVPNQGYV
ncbi:uncharacterized protein LOC144768933 [Lissotriton helveticus]